uniref:UBA domain-containing protein n=1 Tax=Parastrongyloides trichosuri TaxID=131310 RepID=A0A0N4ZVY8_PARTI
MRVTITNEEDVIPLEIGEQIVLKEFLTICKSMLGNLEDPAERLVADVDGRKILPVPENLSKTLGAHNFKDGSFIYIFPLARLIAPLMQQVQSAAGSGQQPTNPTQAALFETLRGMMNRDRSQVAGGEEARIRENAKRLHDQALINPAVLRQFVDTFPSLIEAFEKDRSFDSFYAAFKKDVEAEKRKQEILMRDAYSEEGQRYIAEQIQRQNIDDNLKMAEEYMPESFFVNNLLWIRLKINSVPVLGIIDSGAQTSVISKVVATKCNLMRLIDKRFNGTASGIGGLQRVIGKIHSTSICVNEHLFETPIQVLEGTDPTILIGLDMLKRNQCIIDLQKNVLRFGDGTETSFLSESEAKVEREKFEEQMAVHASEESMDTNAGPSTFVIDTEKLAELMSMGFDEPRARDALKICDNNLELAVNFLFSN